MNDAVRRKIGIFGGSFNPIHEGHVNAAVAARDELGLSEVLMMVANDPWQKAGTLVKPEERFAMVELAVSGLDRITASRLEIDRGGLTYTIDTVATLHEQLPDAELWLLMGADVASSLDTWRDYETLATQVRLGVFGRLGFGRTVPSGWQGQVVELAPQPFSSTAIRKALGASQEPLGLPETVYDYVKNMGLYT